MKAAKSKNQSVRALILEALAHSEAEDGLYFRNFTILHDEDQRPRVDASDKIILDELNQLIREGAVKIDYDQLETTFKLA